MHRTGFSESDKDKVRRWYAAAQQWDRQRRQMERGKPGDPEQNAKVGGLLVEQAFGLYGNEVLVDDEEAIEAEAQLARAISCVQPLAPRRQSV